MRSLPAAACSRRRTYEQRRARDRGRGVTSHAEAAVHGGDHHGPPIANRSSRIEPTILGMFMFIGTEAMLFGSFFAAYFFVRVVNPDASDDLAAAAVRVPEVRRGHQHRDPRDLELHDALGAAVDQARQSPRPPGRARADDPDGNGIPADPVHRVRPRRASTSATVRSPRCSSASRGFTAPMSSSA